MQEACQCPHYQVELKKLSALQNSEVSAFESTLKYCINRASIGTMSSGHHDWEMSVKGGSTVCHASTQLKDCRLRVVDHSYSQAMFHHKFLYSEKLRSF